MTRTPVSRSKSDRPHRGRGNTVAAFRTACLEPKRSLSCCAARDSRAVDNHNDVSSITRAARTRHVSTATCIGQFENDDVTTTAGRNPIHTKKIGCLLLNLSQLATLWFTTALTSADTEQ